MLPTSFRLTSDYDFRRVKRLGKSVTTPFFGLYFARALQSATTRFGIIVTNSLNKRATRRNKVRRMLRLAIAAHLSGYQPGYDVVLVAFRQSLTATYEEISDSFNQALSKTPLL